MELIEPSVTPIKSGLGAEPLEIIKVIERAYRICYKSESKMKEGSEELIDRLLHSGKKGEMIHSSPLEHRRILVQVSDAIVKVIQLWEYGRRRSFMICVPTTVDNSSHGDWIVSANIRSFFDFTRSFNRDKHNECYNKAVASVNNTLAKEFPFIFKTIEYEECNQNDSCYLGEDIDYMTFHVVTTRDVLQEIARHRTLSLSVESTRYCNYSKRGVQFCYPRPYPWADNCEQKDIVRDYFTTCSQIVDRSKSMSELFDFMTCMSEAAYNKAISLGIKPQEARMLLLGGLKTEMIITGRYSDWAHFVKLRNDPAAHPQIIEIAKQIEEYFTSNGIDIRSYHNY